MNISNDTVPRQMRVAECNDVSAPRADRRTHLREERIRPILGDVHGVQRLITMHQRQRGPGDMSAQGTNVDPKRQRAKPRLGVSRDMLSCPRV